MYTPRKCKKNNCIIITKAYIVKQLTQSNTVRNILVEHTKTYKIHCLKKKPYGEQWQSNPLRPAPRYF